MQDQDMMLLPVQPLIKLVQSNMQLLMQFSMSPEVMSQSMTQMQDLMQRNQGAATHIVQSGAFADLIQGLMKNYTQFISEAAQASMSVLTQASMASMNQMQQAGESMANGSGRRARQAARA